MADSRWALHRASAHLFLQQDGNEAGHDAGGERERCQAADDCVVRVHAVRTKRHRHQMNPGLTHIPNDSDGVFFYLLIFFN